MLDGRRLRALDESQHDSGAAGLAPLASSALPRWFCVATLSNLDYMAKAGLQDIGLETFFPQMATIATSGGRKLRSLFPGYGFVKFSIANDPWHRIADVHGVYRLFKHGPTSPTALPPGAVEALQAACDPLGVIYPPTIPVIRPGAVCRLREGPLVNLTGVCAWAQGDRIRLLMNLLGGQATISVQVSAVEVISQ
jgi:transcription antitermination factor NusG